MTTQADETPLLFDAVLQPHRSLSPTGFYVLMAGVTIVSFVAGMAFLLMGAWPVFGFFGLDVLLIYAAFKLSYRAGRLFERVQLSGDELLVWRHFPNGKVRRWSFQPYWVRVEMDRPVEHESQVRLSSHGRSLTIGSFLTPEERADFADALQRALHNCRVAPVQP
ncbi:MAG: DUF2244 domain-containing protein [Minwuiales bacterium]|nr:DUF2244 domain-containing protein [Minwuiales bacterium]